MLSQMLTLFYNAGGLCVPGPLEPLDQAPSRRELESGRVALGARERRFRALEKSLLVDRYRHGANSLSSVEFRGNGC